MNKDTQIVSFLMYTTDGAQQSCKQVKRSVEDFVPRHLNKLVKLKQDY